jgi:hypothetical protein
MKAAELLACSLIESAMTTAVPYFHMKLKKEPRVRAIVGVSGRAAPVIDGPLPGMLFLRGLWRHQPRIISSMRVSLIIPTRERAATLVHCLRASLATDDLRLQVVVSDNCSQDNTREVIEEFSDDRLIYVRTPQRVSMRQNFEFGLKHADGDYVMYIGDDDAFLAFELTKLLALIEKLSADAIFWDPPIYVWPDIDTTKPTNRLTIRQDQYSGLIQKIDLQRVRHDLLVSGTEFNLGPRIYHGCFSRSALQVLIDKCGRAFGGSNPDIYVQYAMSFLADRCFKVSYPFSLNGTSRASTGFSQHSSRMEKHNVAAVNFNRELSADPILDVLPGPLPHLAMYQFATMLTVVRDLGIDRDKLDQRAWCQHSLRQAAQRGQKQLTESRRILADYFKATGQTSMYDWLLEQSDAPLRSNSRSSHRRSPSRRVLRSYVRPGRIIFDPSLALDGTVAGASNFVRQVSPRRNDVDQMSGSEWMAMQWRALQTMIKLMLTPPPMRRRI